MSVQVEQHTDWEPGIPLHNREDHSNSLYLFNFRDSSEDEICACADSASWPAPKSSNDLDRFARSVEDFVSDWHAWVADGRPA